jgi:hypothetical protein
LKRWCGGALSPKWRLNATLPDDRLRVLTSVLAAIVACVAIATFAVPIRRAPW